MDVLPKRFTRFRLTMHPEKTALIAFKRPPRPERRVGRHVPLDSPSPDSCVVPWSPYAQGRADRSAYA